MHLLSKYSRDITGRHFGEALERAADRAGLGAVGGTFIMPIEIIEDITLRAMTNGLVTTGAVASLENKFAAEVEERAQEEKNSILPAAQGPS